MRTHQYFVLVMAIKHSNVILKAGDCRGTLGVPRNGNFIYVIASDSEAISCLL
jgi:hypothetical protein